MILSQDDLDFLAFDPPHLGLPASPSHCGRAGTRSRFVEIFLCIQEEKIVDAGFLTSIPGHGMVCASLCCQALVGKETDVVRQSTGADILGFFPDNLSSDPELREIAALCIQAACAALAMHPTDT